MRLTLIIPGLGSGGAERVLSRLANRWVDRGHEVVLLTLSAEPPFYDVEERIKCVTLGVAAPSSNIIEALRANAMKLRVLRKAIVESRPDVVVSFLDTTNILTCIATLGTHLPVVVSERIDPFHTRELRRIWRVLRRLTYPLAKRIVVQTQSVLVRMRPQLGKRVIVIPNPVIDPGVRYPQRQTSSADRKWVIGLGRLTEQKGFDLLLNAFAQIAEKHSDWSLRIVGAGPDLLTLQRQIATFGLEDRAFLLGLTLNPTKLLVESDLFVMSSRFEGFPNALCEAMACGLPVISFDCPSGPAEIIRNGLDGILVANEDVSALAAAMDSLMSDPQTRCKLSKNAPGIIGRFDFERILNDWERVFSEVRRVA